MCVSAWRRLTSAAAWGISAEVCGKPPFISVMWLTPVSSLDLSLQHDGACKIAKVLSYMQKHD